MYNQQKGVRLQELTKKTGLSPEDTGKKSIIFFLLSNYYSLSGNWSWDMHTDVVFCSDVMLPPPEHFMGTSGIVHPDDLQTVKEELLSGKRINELKFRMITTYGEVKEISGIRFEKQDVETEEFPHALQRKLVADLQQKQESEQLQLSKEAYERAEKYAATGVWWYNNSTNETWYSPQVYRIYDLLPYTLNAHLNTFLQFIHPEEKDQYSEYFNKAFQQRTSLHLEFRIVTPRGEKRLSQITEWFFSSKGEMILSGTLRDITEQKQTEQKVEDAEKLVQFHKQQLVFDEQQAHLGHWQVNLLTRKTYHSDYLFRLFGQKPKSLPSTINLFLNYVHPEDREIVSAANKKMLYEHAAPDIDFRTIRSDGRIRNFMQRAKLLAFGDELVMSITVQDVTVQKSLEKKLKELSHKEIIAGIYQSQAEELIGIGSWAMEISSGHITWSEGLYRMLGLKPVLANLTQHQLLFYVHPDDQKQFSDEWATIINQKQDSSFEFRLVVKGVVHYLRAFFRLVRTEHEEVFLGLLHDITNEKILQQQVHHRVQLAEALSENINDCVLMTDMSNTVVLWNKKCEEVYNIKKEKAIGENYFDLFPALKTAEDIQLFNRVLKGEMIKMHRSLHGNSFYHLLMAPLRNEQDEVTGIVHLLHDLTKEKELHQHLTERLNLISSIVDASVDRIVALDQNMNYLYWNKKAEDYFGLKKEEVVGKNILEVFPAFVNDISFNDFRKALKGEIVHIPAKGKTEHKQEYYETYLIPVKDDEEKITGVLWMVHDLLKEFELQRYKQKENEVLDALNENYIELDDNYCFTYFNQKALQFFNKEKEEVLGKPVHELFPGIEDTPLMKAMRKAMEEGVSVRDEFAFPSNTWVTASIAPTADGIILVFYNIQNLKEVEDNLAENKYLLQQTAASSPDAITVYDLQLRQPVYINQCLASWVGTTNEELVNMGFEGRIKLIHPNDRDKLVAFNKSMESVPDNEVKTLEYRVTGRKGTVIVRNRSKVFKRNEKGEATHILSILQDITEEVTLRKQLMDRTRYAEGLIDASVDRMYVIDRDYIIRAWNYQCEILYHRTKEEAIGKNLFDVFPKIQQQEIILHAYEEAFKGQYVHLPAQQEIYLNSIAERFYIPMKGDDGTVSAILVMVHDVTKAFHARQELRELNESLERKNQQLEQKNEEIASFAFVASHDLKEPLRKIHTFSDWLLEIESEHLTHRGKDYLKRMNVSVKRLSLLIDDIMTLTKIHVATATMSRVNLNDIVRESLNQLQGSIQKTGAVIECDSLPVISGMENQLTVLFTNLIENAIKFQPSDQVPFIHIKSEMVEQLPEGFEQEQKEFVCISFIDNGIGIDKKYAQKIFRVFQQLHMTEVSHPGSGIGLAICKKVMEAHGGFITLESEPGKGAAFQCFFPVA